jgi:hypothetical protein
VCVFVFLDLSFLWVMLFCGVLLVDDDVVSD